MGLWSCKRSPALHELPQLEAAEDALYGSPLRVVRGAIAQPETLILGALPGTAEIAL